MPEVLEGRKILLGVCGGIAICKAAQLASELRKSGAALRIVMTPAAVRMVSPVVFSSIAACEVFTDEKEMNAGQVPHIELSRWAEVLIIAPATANTIAKIAHGMADNLLTLCAIAHPGDKKLLVPSMNVRMYYNPLTQENIEKLQNAGWKVVEPVEGHLACGEKGKGRFPDVEIVLDEIRSVLIEKRLRGKRILVTAGPTREYIDPVRFISNPSSGRMGFALARVARWMGADVVLVSGPVELPSPPGVKLEKVESAREMYEKVMEYVDGVDIIIMAAAVADYTVPVPSKCKIKKEGNTMTLNLHRPVDILKESAKDHANKFIVGFAAETESHLENARKKLQDKGLDMIVVNDVSRRDIGFGSEENEVVIISRDGEHRIPKSDKIHIAFGILKLLCDNLERYGFRS